MQVSIDEEAIKRPARGETQERAASGEDDTAEDESDPGSPVTPNTLKANTRSFNYRAVAKRNEELEKDKAARLQRLAEDTDPNAGTRSVFQFGQGVADSKTGKETPHHPCVLLPVGKVRITWDMMLLLLLIYIAVVTPYRVCFQADAEKFSSIYWWENTIDITFIVDLFLNFRTGYIDKKGNVITAPRLIASKYLGSWFLLDAVSGIPFDLIELASQADTGGASNLRVMKTARVFKIMKILRITKLTKTLKAGLLSEAMEEMTTSTTNRSIIRFLKLLIIVLVFCHWFSCLFVAVDQGWVERFTESYEDGMVESNYVSSFYMVTMTLTTVGYGDVMPVTDRERIFVISLMLVGGVSYSYVIAAMASIVSTMDASESQFNEKMDCVASYMLKQDFPEELFTRVRRYYKHYYQQRTALDERDILDGLSAKLQRDVAQFLIGEIMVQVPVFSGLEPDMWPRVLPVFKFIEFKEDEMVYRHGDAGREMYIVIRGQMMIQDENGHEVKIVQPGDYCGALCALGIERNRYETIVTTTMTKCYMISRDDLQNRLTGDYPEVMKHMRKGAVRDIYGKDATVEHAEREAKRKHREHLLLNKHRQSSINLSDEMKELQSNDNVSGLGEGPIAQAGTDGEGDSNGWAAKLETRQLAVEDKLADVTERLSNIEGMIKRLVEVSAGVARPPTPRGSRQRVKKQSSPSSSADPTPSRGRNTSAR